MKYLLSLIVNISKALAAFGIAAGVALAFVNVVARYALDSSLSWASELTIYLFLWSTFFGAAYCFKKDAHIAVDVFLVKTPPTIQKFLTLVTLVISAIYVGAIAYFGYQYVLLYIDLGEMSVDLDIPLWIPYVVVPISFAFSAIIIAFRILEVLKTPASELELKGEAEMVLEDFGTNTEELLKEVHKKTGGML